MTEPVKTKETIAKEAKAKAEAKDIADAKAIAEAESEVDAEDSKVTAVEIPGKILVKNICKRNVHTSIGKICKDCEGYVTLAEAKAEAKKDPLERHFIEV